MNNVLYAVLVLGILGAAFGLVLAFAAKKFAVNKDVREELISEVLPGANCGGCGFAGCASYAAAVVSGGAAANLCAVGGSECTTAIAEIMGIEAVQIEPCVALVKCSGFAEHAAKKYQYSGISDCVAASRLIGGGPNECPSGCLGFGTCEKACPFGAIHVTDGIAMVDHEKCTGCMTCASSCPRKIIIKVPYSADVTVACSSKHSGKDLRKYCNIGCIGCKICEKTCEHGAITVVDNLARIDYDKCISCGQCYQKCPRHLIRDARLNTVNE